jgi:hypothetical protein
LKKLSFYILVSVLYILTPICILGALGTAVSLKYEVDEGYFAVNTNKTLTESEKIKGYKELDEKGKQLQTRYHLFLAGAFVAFSVATGLLVKRGTILIDKRKAAHNTALVK